MEIAALVTWVVTAVLGLTMLMRWASGGGARPGGPTHFPRPLVFGHPALAAIGLVAWIVYLANDNDALAWIAFVILVLVALGGDLLVMRWAKDRRTTDAVAGPEGVAVTTLAEQTIPTPLVVAHGIFAVATVVLVFLTALGVGES